MHVVTFYSFKGGVGRTMGLVNVAMALAERGRRVLLVDFDLEAPGIDSYIQFEKKRPGVVDYVHDYLKEFVAPEVGPYVQKMPAENGRGDVMVMSAGRQGTDYARRLQQIDWRKLYDEHDGFLLFENLRLQWEKEFNPDYVLIDSRTGHTDVGGICTRQLPDAVALFFFPNEQNFNGLKRIATAIRQEKRGAGRTDILLHCVMSNVPRLDDEDGILETWIDRFKLALQADHVATVHRYDSLQLLNQTLFVNTRPKTSLAREYQAVTDMIVESNLADRDGALKRLSKLGPRGWRKFGAEVIPRIARLHPNDGNIQFELGKAWAALGANEDSAAAFAKAEQLGLSSPELLLRRAEILRTTDEDLAFDYVAGILRREDVQAVTFSRAIELLLQMNRLSSDMASMPAFLTAEIRPELLQRTREGQRLLIALSDLRTDLRDPSDTALAFIGLGEFQKAASAICGSRSVVPKLEIQYLFNYAMAEWGATGEAPKDLLQEMVERPDDLDDPNAHQCFALAHWALGQELEAEQRLQKATQARFSRAYEFSCWRYQELPVEQFLNDVAEMTAELRQRRPAMPAFLKESRKRPT